MVSEFLYAQKTLEEVAGYDDYQMRFVLCRPRNKRGELIREHEELPPGVHVDENGMRVIKKRASYEKMFRRLKAKQCRMRGWDEGHVDKLWEGFLERNPKYGKFGKEER